MKSWFMNLTLARKQIVTFLIAGIVPMIIVSILALTAGSNQLRNQALDQLEAVREIKSSAVKRYFSVVGNQIQVMAQNPTIVNASGSFSRSFNRIIQAEKYSEQDILSIRQELEDYYINEFGTKYTTENSGKTIDASGLLEKSSDIAAALQYLYIQQNANPLGEKHLLDSAKGRSVYHRTHLKYHAGIRHFLEKFGYYDIFIVEPKTGYIVYSVFKELDFGTSLISGPYANTNFAKAYEKARTAQLGDVFLEDFDSYAPSYDAPASFLSTPIYYEEKITGVLIFQIPLEPINEIMYSRAGMGNTGESYLVGPGGLMRSDSYLYPEDHSVASSFRNPEKNRIDTSSVKLALNGKSGRHIIRNYSGEKVLSAYAPIKIKNLTWGIVSEISTKEAFSGITLLTWTLIIFALVGAVIIGVCARSFSRIMTKPILSLSNVIQRVEREGNFQLTLQNDSNDEVGETSRVLNTLLKKLSSAISKTNYSLKELGKGNFNERILEHYPGDLETLTNGVNAAIEQVKQATLEQNKQAEIAKDNAAQAAKAAEHAKEQATQTLIIKQALDASATSVMIADAEFNIVYMNQSNYQLMQDAEENFKMELPAFSADKLMGENIDVFHKNPAHQRRMLKELTGSYKTQLDFANLNFNVSISAIRDEQGAFLGAVIEWDNITEKLAKEVEEKRIANENSRIRQALDSSSTSAMITDEKFDIIYTNRALNKMMENAEADLKKQLPNFSAQNLLGSNMDNFHKSPEHQRSLIQDITSAFESKVEVGGRTFTVTANPITNNSGERIGTVVEWLDRTGEVAIEKEIDDVITAAASGDFSKNLELSGKQGFFLKVGQGLNQLLSTTNIAVADIIRVFSALANGDLSQTIDRSYEGEFAELKRDANTTIEKLRDIIDNISASSSSISRSASEISSGNADLSQRTEEQASSLEETASGMEEMINIVHQSEENASYVNDLASRSVEIARKGDESVQATSKAMSEISSASTKIANIIGVIDEIAFQTNLLALNAAVEAARAGEQGRGFAVVAGEVRNLAQRSASAAKEIKELIQDSVNKVEDGSVLVKSSGETLRLIVKEIEKVGEVIARVAHSAQEQTQGIEQVNKAVEQMDQMTQQNAALVEQASAASESMASQAREMDEMISFFRR